MDALDASLSGQNSGKAAFDQLFFEELSSELNTVRDGLDEVPLNGFSEGREIPDRYFLGKFRGFEICLIFWILLSSLWVF